MSTIVEIREQAEALLSAHGAHGGLPLLERQGFRFRAVLRVAEGRLRIAGSWVAYAGYFNPKHSWQGSNKRYVALNHETRKSWFAAAPTQEEFSSSIVFQFSSPRGWPTLFYLSDEVWLVIFGIAII